jgi:hypothetical protein
MELVAVELHYQPLGSPERIDLESRDGDIEGRKPDRSAAAEGGEPALELRARVGEGLPRE